MHKAVEFDIEKEELKKYIEECLNEENIDYEIKIEDRWHCYNWYINNKWNKANTIANSIRGICI